ncbi:hypothetical protein [Streptomyces sp. NPDC002599]|uniref:hypothetical protein n=1 Tax=Streptomyces sp. NPDC002599 TaxID=3154421 RepID=UPI003328D65F
MLWTGEILMTDARSDWDLDTAPPSAVHSKQDLSGTDSTLVVTGEDEAGFYNADMAITPSGPQTTEAQCVDRLQTHAVRSLGLPSGKTFCLKTKAGRTALVTVAVARGPLDADLRIKVWNDSSSS